MTNDTTTHPQPTLPPPRRAKVSPRMMTAGAILAVLALGAAGGAGASRYIHNHRPQAVLLLQPAPIAQLKERTPVAVKGQVAEVYGNKFIVQDDSGRTLVDTGPRGEGALVPKGETVTVQGQFDNGVIHANVLTRADGTSQAFGPPHPHHDRGPGGPGPRADRGFGPERGPGPGRGPDAPPPQQN